VCVCVCVWIAATSRIRRLTISLLLWRGWQIPADGEKRLPTIPPPACDTRAFAWYVTHVPASRCIPCHYNYRLEPLLLPGSALSGRRPEHRTHRIKRYYRWTAVDDVESRLPRETGRPGRGPYANKYFIVYMKYIMWVHNIGIYYIHAGVCAPGVVVSKMTCRLPPSPEQ